MSELSRSCRPPARRETTGADSWLPAALAALILVSCSRTTDPAASARASPTLVQTPAAPPDVEPPGAQGEPFAASRSYDLTGRAPKQAWFICDGIGAGRIFVIGLPDGSGRVSVLTIDKSRRTAPALDSFRLGPRDAGAGQVYWPLSTRTTPNAGNLHAFNPGALGDPADASTPTFTSLTLGSRRSDCRWTARTRLLGVSARRTFLITQGKDGAPAYLTFDFKDAPSAPIVEADGAQRSTRPSLEIGGGEETPEGFVFRKDGYVYTVEVSGRGQPPQADVLIARGGKLIGAEAMQAYTYAPKP